MKALPKTLVINTPLKMSTRVAPAELVSFGEKVRWELRTGSAATELVIPVAGLREVARGGGDVGRVLAIYLEGAALAHGRQVFELLLAVGATGSFNIRKIAEAVTAGEVAEDREGGGGGRLLAAMVADLVWLQVVPRAGLGVGDGKAG